jgi:hypothetical protein
MWGWCLRGGLPRLDTMVWVMERGRRQHSYLFTVRLWAEDLGDGQAEWRGRVERVTSGEVYYFRDWSTLISLLINMLPDVQVARLPGEAASAPSDEEASSNV